MDWERYDLDGDQVVIRPPSRIASRRSPPGREARSAKPTPRSAGSVYRPGRCGYVMELIQFCHDYDAVLQCSSRPPWKLQQHHFRPSDTRSQQLRSQSSRSSLRHRNANQSTKRRPKQHKSKECLFPAITTKKRAHSSTEVKAETTQSKDVSSSTTPIFGSQGLHRLPLSADSNSAEANNDNGKNVDCECHYPGVSVLPGEKNYVESDQADQADQAEEAVQANKTLPESTSQSTAALHFTSPGKKEERHRGDSVSSANSCKSASISTSSQQGIHASHLSPASQSVSSELESPSTVATSPLYEILAPFPEPSDEKNSESKHIQSRFLPPRGSSKKAIKSAPSGSSNLCCRLEDNATQVPNTSPSRERTSASIKANNSRVGGLGGPRVAAVPSVRAGPLSNGVTGGEPTGRSHSYLDKTTAQSARSKSFDALPSAPICSKSSTLAGTAASDSDLPSGSPETEVQRTNTPTASTESSVVPGTQQQKLSRSASIFAQRMQGNRQLTRNISNPLLRGQAFDGTQIHTPSPGSSTPTQEEFLGKISSHLPLSPRRTQCPGSPPDVPLPADPPVPPSRCSSRNRLLGSSTRGTAYPSQLSSDSLARLQTPSRRPSLVNAESVRNVRSPSPVKSKLNRRESQGHQRRPSSPTASPSGVVNVEDATSRRGSRPFKTPASGAIDNHKDNQGNLAVNPNPALSQRARQDIKPTSPVAESPQTYSSRCHSLYYNDTDAQQQSHSIPTSPEAQTSQDLEFRVAFLEQQNKMLHTALVAALDSKASSQDSTKTSPRADGSSECPTSPVRLCTSPANNGA